VNAEATAAIHSRIPFDDYCQIEAVSITRLKELSRSPQHYRHRLEVPKETAPLILGRAAHCAVLEPERFTREFAVWERRSENTGNLCPRNGKWWEAFQSEHQGKDIITADERDAALEIQQAVRSNSIAMRYLESGEPEVSMEWQMGAEFGLDNRKCKGRADWITRIEGAPYVVGLKTARDCRPFIFGSAAAKLGYALQWAFYFDGHFSITGVNPGMVEIVVESEPPHAVVVYRIEDDILVQGRENYVELLKLLAQCEASGRWPGPAESEQVLTLPSWYYQSHDDISELGLIV
jgi:hypothetical protein